MKKHQLPLLFAVAAGLASVFAPTSTLAEATFPLYVSNNGGGTIWKFASDGVGSLFDNSGLITSSRGLAFDTSGNLYAAMDLNPGRIVKYTPGGVGSYFADTADLNSPRGLAFDTAGNLYAANAGNNTIVRFTPEGVSSVFASTGLSGPQGLAFDVAGNLYADNAVDNTIEKFTPAGVGSLFANTAAFSHPFGLAFDSAGNLYAADTGYPYAIEKFTSAGVGSVFADYHSGLWAPIGLAFDTADNLYVANNADSKILKFTPGGVSSVFASTSVSAPYFIAFAPTVSLLPGDFNGDSVVDAADYVVWRKTGINGQQGYDDWRSHFSQPAGSGAALPSAEPLSAAVSEPATLMLSMIAASGWSLRRRRTA